MNRKLFKIVSMFVILSFMQACEKTEYDLLDPESAGVWELYDMSTGMPSNKIRGITLDIAGNLWVAFDGKGVGMNTDGNWTFFETTNSPILSNSTTSIEAVPDGRIVIGTANGLSYISPDGQWSSYKDPLVATMPINCIKASTDGILWIGTQNQGFYIEEGTDDPAQIKFPAYPNVYAIEEDQLHNIYLGTDNGIIKWDGTNLTTITVADGLPDNEVTALFCDSRNRLWIGTYGGLTVSYLDDSGLNQVSLMMGSSGTYVWDICEDGNGDIWFGTWYDGLIRYDGVIAHSYKEYNGFYEDNVNCLDVDKDGHLWFGLYSRGLVKYTLPLK